MFPLTTEEIFYSMLSGILRGLWIFLKAAWPYLAALVGIKYVFNIFKRK